MKRLLLLIPAVLCPILLVVWQLVVGDINYYLVSVLLLVLSMLPFFVLFERRKPSARELSLTAGLIAIAVVSRAAFYLVPQVKPIGAVVVVAGVCLGAERGYFVGAMSAFISNFIFVQGVWTPFQMVALGMVGLLSGLIFRKIKADRIRLAVVSFVLCFAVYGLITDLCSVLVMSGDLSLQSALAVYSAGLPFSLAFGVSSAVFSALFGEPFVRKLNRIIIKYDILEA